jgi:hypothetical protein
VQAAQHRLQRLGGRRNDLCVEGVADGQEDGLVAGGRQLVDGGTHGRGGSADDRLLGAVDVGNDDIAVDAAEGVLDLFQRGEHGGHEAVVLDRDVDHLPAASADGFEGVGEAERSGRDERAVLAQAVAHDHVGFDAVLAEQAG